MNHQHESRITEELTGGGMDIAFFRNAVQYIQEHFV